MNLKRVEEIAEAVLYEGYMLYPYRPSSIKNQQRWNFGVLYPESHLEKGSDLGPSDMQTECLLNGTQTTRLTVKVRFLQIVQRSIGRLCEPGAEVTAGAEPNFSLVDRLEVAGRIYQPWQEAVEQEVTFSGLDCTSLTTVVPSSFTFPSGKALDYLRDEQKQSVGVIVREWESLSGSVEMKAKRLRDGVFKVTVRVLNRTRFDYGDLEETSGRQSILLHSLVSAHTILGVGEGEFISLLDPPADIQDFATECNNVGVWPVLAGEDASTVLASPIILYDYPQIAPESAGNLFDSTEIDEILSLRILTLTEKEKQEMRQSDDRTREILERTESMPEEQFMKLHGVLRGLTAVEEKAQ